MLSSNWAAALEPNIMEWIHEGFNTHPDTTTDIFKVKDESTGVIRLQDSWGPRLIPSSTEDGATSLLEKQKGYQTLLAPTIYKGKMKISREMKRWNDYQQIEDDAKDLGSAAKETLNLISNGVFVTGLTLRPV